MRSERRLIWLAAIGKLVFLSLWIRHFGMVPGDREIMMLVRAFPEGIVRFCAFAGGVPTIAGLTVLLAWLHRKYVHPLTVIGAMVPIPIIEWILKHLIGRPRPLGEGLAFPSGHAIASLTLLLLIAGYAWSGRSRTQRVVFSLFFLIYVVAVGVGRVALGFHWPSDILGGWLVAVIYVSGILRFLQYWRQEAGSRILAPLNVRGNS
ncbi:MAG: phosphatase PAP2 family protein [Armatimonadota bacterium]|nr:phosphatase PAP2 family protein [Armatimonadota bacterium]